MIGDYFSKPLQGSLFRTFRDVVMGIVHHSVIEDLPDKSQERVGSEDFDPVKSGPSSSNDHTPQSTTSGVTEVLKAAPRLEEAPTKDTVVRLPTGVGRATRSILKPTATSTTLRSSQKHQPRRSSSVFDDDGWTRVVRGTKTTQTQTNSKNRIWKSDLTSNDHFSRLTNLIRN